ncbi:MAG: cysteine hydrolase family protein [Proteobacteria bacterium]|nr:cysteine hydrolase family protein [Pseudomonadota bacterium]
MSASALIIIDMQVGSFTAATPRRDADALVARLNALAARLRQNSGIVIFIQHDGPDGDPHHPSLPGWHLLPALRVLPGDKLITKTACDAFLDTDLEALLTVHDIGELIITGCATDYCVDTTVRSALARGYRTTAPSDGHTTADRAHLNAAQIIAHHNAIWADFIAPGGSARVRPCAEIAVER